MELLPVDTLSLWLTKYGSFIIFILLSLGILALPIPEETLMVVAGILMNKGKLNIPLTVLFAYAGTIFGISVSYALGRTAGKFLVKKYGGWFRITEERLEKAHYWFERFGKWLLFIGYFIPGIRHLTGFSAGMTYMRYSHFALFAYFGAVIWVSLFLSLGYFFGNYWFCCFQRLEKWDLLTALAIIIALGLLTFYLLKMHKKQY